MKEFKFSYDESNDDLFVYLDGAKSSGAIEFGNLVMDFDEKENLVAIQIINASEFISKLVSKIIEISKIVSIKAEVINFRNIAGLKLKIRTEKDEVSSNILVPRIKQHSPALYH